LQSDTQIRIHAIHQDSLDKEVHRGAEEDEYHTERAPIPERQSHA